MLRLITESTIQAQRVSIRPMFSISSIASQKCASKSNLREAKSALFRKVVLNTGRLTQIEWIKTFKQQHHFATFSFELRSIFTQSTSGITISRGVSEKTFRTWKCALGPKERWLKGEIVGENVSNFGAVSAASMLNAYVAFATSARHSLPALADQPSKVMLWWSIWEARLICAPRLWRTGLCQWLRFCTLRQ